MYAEYRRCAGGQIHNHRGLRFWLHPARGFWLLSDHEDDQPGAACFCIDRAGLSLADRPWRDGHDLARGLERANARVVRGCRSAEPGAERAASPD